MPLFAGSHDARRLGRALMAALAAASLATVLAFPAGCAGGGSTPATLLQQYGAALERGDHAAAYRLMSESYRRRVSLAEFTRRLTAAAADTRVAGRALRENGASWAARVEVPLGADERALLVRDGSQWRLARAPFEPFSQDTPRAALRSFIQAIESERWDVLVDLAPARYRAEVTPEKLKRFWQGEGAARRTSLLSALRLALDRHVIVEEGEDAFLPYAGGREVRLVREEGLWRIETPE